MVAEDAAACDLAVCGVSHAEIGSPELVLAFGGDGTILKAVHLLGPVDAPILGVNLGRLGFLSGASDVPLDEVVDAALAGDARIEQRQTLEASVSAGGRDAGTFRALNEVCVGRGGGVRAVEIEVLANGVPLMRRMCDGVIVATPTGSTAYALSAGGPLVSPEVRGMVIVTVAPHSLAARPIVLGPADHVTVRCLSTSRSEACVTIDGDPVPCRAALDSVEVRAGSSDVRLMRLDGRGFFETLADTFLRG
jgi:NAD+ kinase